MNWRSGFSCSVIGCAAITCVGCGPALHWGGARGTAFIEWGGESSFCEKVCIFIEWTLNTHTFEQLNFGRLGAGLLSRSPPSLRSSGRRLSSRGRARVASRASPLTLALSAGAPHLPPDVWLLSRSSSSSPSLGRPGKISPLGRAMRWRRSGSSSLLLGGASRHHVTHCFRALLSLSESLGYGLHGITEEAGGRYRSV